MNDKSYFSAVNYPLLKIRFVIISISSAILITAIVFILTVVSRPPIMTR